MTLLGISRTPATYRVLSYVTTLLYLSLFSILLFSPQSLLTSLGVAGNDSAYFLARRASVLMLGFAILSFNARNAPCSAARQAITLAIAISMAGLAVLSIFEYLRGFASAGILPAGATEAVLAILYFALWLFNRSPTASITPSANGSRA